MKKFSAVILFLYVMSISGFAQSLSYIGEKTESDTIANSLRESVRQVTALKGVEKDKTLAVLIVEDSGKESFGFGGGGSGPIKSLMVNIPVIGWFITANSTEWSAARMAQPTESGRSGNMYSRSSIAEAFIISELVDRGYNVVEASIPFYGDMHQLKGEDLQNYGRELGADTVIIGSVAGSVFKVIKEESYFTLNKYFISDLKMNLRSVDTRSRRVLDSDTYSGVDSVNTLQEIKWPNVLMAVGTVIFGIAALSAMGSSDDDEYDDYNDGSY